MAEFIKEVLFTTSEDAEGRSVTTWETILLSSCKLLFKKSSLQGDNP